MVNESFLISAGITFVMGVLSMAIWLSNRKIKVYLYFSLVSIFSGINFLFARPELNGEYASIFLLSNAIYWSAFPWFVSEYTGYKKDKPILITILTLLFIAYFSFLLSISWWNRLAHTALLLIVAYCGFIILKTKNYKKDYLLVSIYSIFTLLALEEIVYSNFFQESIYRTFLGFWPLDFYGLLFSLVMGTKMVSDISKKRQYEKTLIVNEHRWSSLMQNIKLIVLRINKAGTIDYVNPYFQELTGYEIEEANGREWSELFPSKSILKDRRPSSSSSSPKKKIRTKYGEEKWILWSEIPLINEEGEGIGFFRIGYDITESEQSLSNIKHLKDKLEKEKIALEEKLNFINTDLDGIIGNSDTIQYAVLKARQVSGTSTTVLIEGETGVGKELFANLIHSNSDRSNRAFMKINCAAIPRELMESELFGHEKGAFTSASITKKGVFELADGGTIFLDEVGEMPLELQPKLLRVLQNGEFNRIGGGKTFKVDVRIISATNRSLLKLVEEGEFREDLYYRLNVYPITVPPLRKRKEDIPELIRHFIRKISHEMSKNFDTLSKHDMNQLISYHWPGNIRQLENILERSIINSTEPVLEIDALDSSFSQKDSSSTLEEMEKKFIRKTLEECDWKINGPSGAAEKLGINPNTLRSKMKKLKIIRPEIR